MAELLLELFSEEIPARMQKGAAEQLNAKMREALDAAKLPFGNVMYFVTPRRLAVVVEGLPKEIAATESEKRGPKIGAPQGAIDGFCKASGLDASKLEQRDGYYFGVVKTEGGAVEPVLKAIIEKIITEFHWPKSMRWGAYPQNWVRPLQNILCLFDGKVVPVSFGHITANDNTYGHRFLHGTAPIKISASTDYFTKLKDAKVIVCANERRSMIEKAAASAASAKGLAVKPDVGLLEEVTGLVEWPVVLIGGFEKQYLGLPQEVPTTVMRSHQKYFALLDNAGKLAPNFLVVANTEASDGGKIIVAGNERVLRARLSDGQFFYDQDLKTKLGDWNKGLTDMVFHAKLGSVADKVERIKSLAAQIAKLIKADEQQVARAAELCKADLTTGMVGEFPELQGLMGRYYALAQGEKPEVADAIRDHYAPLGPDAACPTAPVSMVISLADKLDTLVGMFAVDEKPTGSKDPFALRRAALGVIRIILENNLRLSLGQLLNTANASAANQKELLEFFAGRLKVQLKEQGIRHDVIGAVMEDGDDDLVRVTARAKAVQDFLSTEDGKNLLAAYTRSANIVRIDQEKNGKATTFNVQDALLQLAEEKALHQAVAAVSPKVDASLKSEDYASAMSALATLRAPVDAFFDKVIVNADEENLRKNRLNLLSSMNGIFAKTADFSKIEG